MGEYFWIKSKYLNGERKSENNKIRIQIKCYYRFKPFGQEINDSNFSKVFILYLSGSCSTCHFCTKVSKSLTLKEENKEILFITDIIQANCTDKSINILDTNLK
jgi:hypothetical protein